MGQKAHAAHRLRRAARSRCPYTLTHNLYLLVGIQALDGVGAGIFGVVSVLVIADLTRGTGHFNLRLGAIATALGIDAALSQTIAGSIAHHFSNSALAG